MFTSLKETSVFGLKVATLSLVVAVGFVAAAQSDFANAPSRGCGTYVEHDKVVAFEKQFLAMQKRQTSPTAVTPTTFDVDWTVVTANETIEGGWIPREQMEEQVKVLNDDYAGAGISWRLAGVKYVHNRDWFENAWQQSTQEQDMKYIFRTGDASIMNVFTIGFNSTSETLGFATIPQWYPDNPLMDGVVIRYSTMPGGSTQYYNFGRTLTHEAGHWLGLYHTFQGGCDGDGDFVIDTPAEALAAKGCPIGMDSCPGGGEDPIHNFMDYSVDQCMTGFTPGQIERMHQFIQMYRQPTTVNYTFPYWDTQNPM